MADIGGYVGNILRVNLATGRTQQEPLDERTAYNFLGGRGYATKLLYDELRPKTDPLGVENKIVFMTGPLTGTAFPGSGRIAISSKSPLTGTIFDSSLGGSFGVYLKQAGFDGIIVEGKSETPTCLIVDEKEVYFEDGSDLWGRSTSQTEMLLRERHTRHGVATIGPAGENRVFLANIMSDTRAAGRGGLGAVMGSKNLKALVVGGARRLEVVDKPSYEALVKKFQFMIETDPVTGKDGSMARFGTAGIIHRIRIAGLLPKNNFSSESSLDFNDVDRFSGETIKEKFYFGRKGCYLCPTACGRRIKVDGKIRKGPEYESIVMLGPNSGFFDYEREIVPLSLLCDELGLDTISTGNILGYARSVGVIQSLEDAVRLVHEIAHNQCVFSKGVRFAEKDFGKEGMHVKGLELPAYDPRGARGIALAYATSNRGGCHLRAYTIAPEIMSNPEFIDPKDWTGKAQLVKRMQDSYAVYDSAVLCKYHSLALFTTLEFELQDIAGALSAVTGLAFTDSHLREVGERINTLERLYNVREGFKSESDSLPKSLGVDLQRPLEEYYALRGWRDGVPTGYPLLNDPKHVRGGEITVSPLMRLNPPQIQVALDMDADVETIARIARRTYLGGARVIEAGTPAIKRHGVDTLLPALKRVAPEAIIVADLKTADVGRLEARIAIRAGADIVAVLGMGGKSKITEALSEAIRKDRGILIDLIDCEDPVARLNDLAEDFKGKENWVIFGLHKGISEQIKSRGIYTEKDLITKAKQTARNFPLAVAGGVSEGVAKDIASCGVEVVVVGSAIYNSADPENVTRRLLSEIRESYRPQEKIKR